MADTPTLHSRLRVLVARAFRAEKLYSSMRSVDDSYGVDATKLAEFANSVRSSVWQRRHSQLRVALNNILSGAGSDVAGSVASLKNQFAQKADEFRESLENNRVLLTDTVNRGEFAHALKLTVELIRSKAEMQANQVIADELSSVLQVSRRSAESSTSNLSFNFDDSSIDGSSFLESSASNQGSVDAIDGSNVIPFRRRLSLR